MKSALSPESNDDLRKASARLRDDGENGLTFGSMRHALGFYFERGEAMSAPVGCHPRGEKAPDGTTVVVQVDGGRGGSIDDVHATLQTIRQAMADLQAEDRLAHDMIVIHLRDGKSQAETGKAFGMSASSAQVHLGRAIGFLTGWLRREGVVRPGR